MKPYKVNIEVLANNPEEVNEKLQAFQDLSDHLNHEDFISSTAVIVENPDIIEFVKEVVPEEGKELTLTDYVLIAKKAFERFSD
ncbi:hypothetical protein NBT05_12370 [Aquimarina sp. ERC-38]|uniref:hypothetical protein n=1 Tax=Aquimarina sp. ERC-38 TaxID=2949996 RepID=UPI0022461B94|nr:hypothetical protein [Aquimarina sp. ERC-38]UZO79743.1 hypothetical protein NBT05_12370 [Aquimarina sp. ERC-38]